MNNLEKDKIKFINALWKGIPQWLRWFIITAIFLGGMFKLSTLHIDWKNQNSSVRSQNQTGGVTTETFTQNNNTQNFYTAGTIKASSDLPCRFFIEVLANVKEIGRVLNESQDEVPDTSKAKFIFDDYDRYDPAFGISDLDRQIKNFYVNLKKINAQYSRKDIEATKGMGEDVLSKLQDHFSCSEYSWSQSGINAASADTVVASGSIYNFIRNTETSKKE